METDKDNEDSRIHKYRYFYSEKELVRNIRKKTGMCLPDQPHARNPLTYLLEAGLHKYTIKILKDEMHKNVYPKLALVHISINTIFVW